jgi:hypothetical protein
VDTNNTFLLTGYRTSGSGASVGARMLRGQLTAADTVTFDRSIAGAPDDIAEIFWQAVQLKDGSVVQQGNANFPGGTAQTVVALTSLNTNRAVAFASVQPVGGQNTGRSPSTGGVLGVGSATLALTSNSQLTLDRNDTADQADIAWFVVGFGAGSLLVPATGGSAISADTAGGAYTSLTGPTYTEIQNGNVGVGTIILKAPAGFLFDTNATLPTVLVTRVGGSGADALNIKGVASGTSAAMTSVTTSNLTFTVTSASSGGVTCSLTWQDIRVRPSAGTPLVSGNIANSGTAVIQGITTNSTSFGFLAEVVGNATKLGIANAPSSTGVAGVEFVQQPVIQIQDQFGNARTADNSTVVVVTNNGSALLQGTTNVTAAGGLAAFSGLSYQLAATIKLGFAATGLTGATSGNIVVSPAPASQLTILTQPSSSATAGFAFPQQPVIRVEDQFGNLQIADNSTVVTAEINQGSDGLLGTTNLTAVGGLVTFTNLSYLTAETITIDFSSGSLDPETSASVFVNPASQTITFGPLPNKIHGEADFAVSASASSGLAVTFSIVSGPATVSSNIVSISGPGVVMVRASQSGNATFAAATPVDQSFTVTKANSAIAVSTSANPSPTGSNVTFMATVTAVSPGSGTPTGTVQFLANSSPLGASPVLAGGVASVSTSSLSHGTHTITAEYAGDGNFFGSTNTLSPEQAINTQPAAANDNLQRYATSGAKVRVSTLFNNDTDADADPFTLSSVSPTSTEGGTVVVSGAWVLYTPPTGFTNSDSFAYVIADSGGLQATGSVSVVTFIDSVPSQNVDSIEDLGNGVARIRFNGIPGRIYSVQYTENLQTPDWQLLGTATADSFGQFDFTDTPPINSLPRFYRSTHP